MDQLKSPTEEQFREDFKPARIFYPARVEDGDIKTIPVEAKHLKEEQPWFVEIGEPDNTIKEGQDEYKIPYNSIQYTNTYKMLQEGLKDYPNTEILTQLTESLQKKYRENVESFREPVNLDMKRGKDGMERRIDPQFGIVFWGNGGSYFAPSEAHTQYGGEALRFTLLVRDSRETLYDAFKAYSVSGILGLKIRKILDNIAADENEKLELASRLISEALVSQDESIRVIDNDTLLRRVEQTHNTCGEQVNEALGHYNRQTLGQGVDRYYQSTQAKPEGSQ